MTVCLLTGATGTFGQAFLGRVLGDGWTVRAFSRDEHKQHELRTVQGDVRWIIGDVRDRAKLTRAMEGCDVVVHAAALKHVTSCERNPGEALFTNAVGSWNVVEACLDAHVEQAVLLSSDKAVHPVNVYGMTKGAAEKCWLGAGAYGGDRCKFSVVRYGNVKGSRGSVLDSSTPVTLTDSRATRFWMNVTEAVDLVLLALRHMRGGEVFIPKLSGFRVADIVPAGGQETGLRRGEKLHETLISDEEISRTWDCGTHYLIADQADVGARRVPANFRYSSEAA